MNEIETYECWVVEAIKKVLQKQTWVDYRETLICDTKREAEREADQFEQEGYEITNLWQL